MDISLKTEKGFTLLEVLVAIVLLVVGVAVLVGLFSNALIGSSDAENTTIAMNLIQGRMEEIRNLGFSNIIPEPKVDVSGFPGFQRKVSIDDPEGDPTVNDLKQVTVTVYWIFKGNEVNISAVTYVSRN